MRGKVALSGLNFVTASWVTGIMLLATKKMLEDGDLPALPTSDQAAHTKDWIRAFEDAVAFARSNGKNTKIPSMFSFLLWEVKEKWLADRFPIQPVDRSNRIASGICKFFGIVASVSVPVVIQQVIDLAGFRAAVTDEMWDSVPIPDFPGFKLVTKNAYVLATIIVILKVAASVFSRLHDTIGRRTAFNIRTVLITGISRKTLRARADPRFSAGYVLNLLNVDSENIALAAEQLHLTWSLLFQILVAIALLSVFLGSAVIAGVATVVVALSLIAVIVPMFIISSLPKLIKESDVRVKIIRETLHAFHLIKIRGLVAHFQAKISAARKAQLGWLSRFLDGAVSFVVVGQFAYPVAVSAAITLYATQGNTLTASIIFPSVALFSLLVMPLIELPQMLNAMAMGVVSWNRVQEYLLCENQQILGADTGSQEICVLFENASFGWSQSTRSLADVKDFKQSFSDSLNYSESDQLNASSNIQVRTNISIKRGSFVAIIGHVGAGKSSILSAILGELEITEGKIAVDGQVAYCPQQPWIRTGTVEENILFGADHDRDRLDEAIRVCHLLPDLAEMPNGVQTVLGEKGITISGGQKTRIALARAVYSNADICLLDDPLSSLDATVSRGVFNDCFKSALKGKTILLATHNHDILDQTDHIIFLFESGRIIQGTHEELQKISEFTEFVTAIDKQKADAIAKEKKQKFRIENNSQNANIASVIVDEEIEIGSVKWHTLKSYVMASGVGMNLVIHRSIMRSTMAFHESALSGVLNAPVWWFESQQIGRIMNRFTKDIAAIDQRMLPQIFQLVAAVGILASFISSLSINAPYALVTAIPLGPLYTYALWLYRSSMRQLKRLESVQRSPLYSHVSESLEGISSIKAFNKYHYFNQVTIDLLDFSNRPMFYKFGAEIWITLRLEILSGIFLCVISALSTQTSIVAADKVGNILLYANTLNIAMTLLLQSAANMETELVCVERLVEYGEKVPREGPGKLEADPSPEEWPQSGDIEFTNVTAFYHSAPDNAILKNVSVKFAAGERVCVVGRSGSGKSTLLRVILRFVEKTGCVTIDNREIESVGFETLRSAMEAIPQDVHLLSGTLRSTLDQHGVFSDDRLWAALDAVRLRRFVADLADKLDTAIENGGISFSLGQRQLLCFARVLLLKPKIVLLDEATSSVDPDTERTIRQVLWQQFAGTTVVAVLHRLQESVLDDFEKVIVMDGGHIIEVGAPRQLLATPSSAFAALYAATSGNERQ
ncbi:ABC transporter C member 13 [Entophlyctis luteolus]|nr:ABC transporter C member 13 [Entophlyctis luteolus]